MKKWSGQLPRRNYKNPSYSTKVFLGGVPWDITEGMQTLMLFIEKCHLSYRKTPESLYLKIQTELKLKI